jgi:hypothetical protein
MAKKEQEPDSPDAAQKPLAADEPLVPANDDVEPDPEIKPPASAVDGDDSEGAETEDLPAAAAGEHDE